MARLRYVRSLEQIKQARESDPEFLPSTVRSIRCVYETDARIAAALLPRPLTTAERPEVCVTFCQVAIHISPQFTMEIGSAIFGVRARYDGTEGIYLLTMPMTTEQAVIGGRETYGEPKKIAAIEFTRAGERVASKVSHSTATVRNGAGAAAGSWAEVESSGSATAVRPAAAKISVPIRRLAFMGPPCEAWGAPCEAWGAPCRSMWCSLRSMGCSLRRPNEVPMRRVSARGTSC